MSVKAPVRSVAIVGFGLIGASLAAALRARDPQVRIVAIDRRSVLAELSRHCDQRVDVQDDAAFHAAMSACDLTVLATPVAVIEQHLERALSHSALVTDCGSTKSSIVRRAQGLDGAVRFVPGHPMAGASAGGHGNARADLFVGRRWLLCTDVGAPAHLEQLKRLVRFVGAEPVTLSADDHDAAVAITSHLPQLLASLLAVISDHAGAGVAAGPGFDSATRVAGGNPSIWQDIFASNAEPIAQVSRQLAKQLEQIAADLERGDASSALEALKQAGATKAGAEVARGDR